MTRTFWRALYFNTISVLAGVVLLFAGISVPASIHDDGLYHTTADRVLGTVISAAIAAAALFVVIRVRAARARWMREHAIYETYDAFAAYAKERKGLILQVGRMFLLGAAAHGAVFLQLFGQSRQLTIRECYGQIQEAWRDGRISDVERRDAIDELLEEAADRNSL